MSSTCYLRCSGLNMSSEKLKQNLYLLFSEHGEVVKISLQPGKDTLAWIVMATEQEAQLATYSLNDTQFFNGKLTVQVSEKNTTNI
ncbi:U2 small nuclear ribonucleoprotein B'' [Monosporozyma servazzii]